jgi:hypothetical protein
MNRLVLAALIAGCGPTGALATVSSSLWSQEQKLFAPDLETTFGFGSSACLDGDIAVVSGVVFVRQQGTWIAQPDIASPPPRSNGEACAVSGDTVLLARGPSLYIFVRRGDSWLEEHSLTLDENIWSMSVEGDTALIATTGLQDPARVLVRNGGVWSEQQELTPSVASGWTSVSLSGDTALVGKVGSGAGAAYVFVRSGVTWIEQQRMATPDEFFGSSVSLSGDTALVGAPSGFDQGAAYVFVRSGGIFVETQRLTSADGADGDGFGEQLSLDGEGALVTAEFDGAGGPHSGAAYLFVRRSGVFVEEQRLTALDGLADDRFGSSASLSGDTALIGAPFDDHVVDNGGSAYAYTFSELALGAPCQTDVACLSGHCVDGVCCDTACGRGDARDCQACSLQAGASADGTCGPATAATLCRPGGECDAAEHCDGTALTCPADVFAPDGSLCAGGTCGNGICRLDAAEESPDAIDGDGCTCSHRRSTAPSLAAWLLVTALLGWRRRPSKRAPVQRRLHP